MNNKLSEEELRNVFVEKFHEKNSILIKEVPVFCRSIDLVKYCLINETVTAIEFKLNDWKRALRQALKVAICFDFLEVCIPAPKKTYTLDCIISECESIGVGLYIYHPHTGLFQHVLLPLKVNQIWDIQKRQIIRYVGEQCNGQANQTFTL